MMRMLEYYFFLFYDVDDLPSPLEALLLFSSSPSSPSPSITAKLIEGISSVIGSISTGAIVAVKVMLEVSSNRAIVVVVVVVTVGLDEDSVLSDK